MSYGVQFVALVIILVVTLEFFRYRRINLLTTKMYEILLGIAALCVILEALCLFSCFHPEYFTIISAKSLHQVFFASLNIETWMIYMYIDIRTRSVKSYSNFQFIWRTIPLLISIGMVLFGDVYYYSDVEGAYAYGLIPQSSYFSFICYYALILFLLIKPDPNKDKLFQYEFILYMALWGGIVFIQYLIPVMVLASSSVCLSVLFFYLIFENSKEYSDKDINSAFSRHSFEYTVQELLKLGKRFWVINFSLQNVETIRSTYGHKICMQCLEQAIKNFPEFKSHNIFRTLEYSFCFILHSEEELSQFYSRYKPTDRSLLLSDYMVAPSFYVCSVECPEIVSSSEDLMDLLSFCKNEHVSSNVFSIQEIDKTMAKKREYRVAIEKLLQKAVDEDGFEVYYQPIINSVTGRCVFFEALVRLKDSESLGYVSPEVFIPIAEQKGIISKLGDKVINKVCEFVRKYNLDKRGFWGIGINLSGMQMMDPSLPYRLNQSVKNYDINPKFINFEVTETVALTSGNIVKKNVDKLKKFGYKFSMDDFGTGYSNFSNMASISYDLVKIDKSIIWDAFDLNNHKSMTVLLSIINLIHSVGCSVVAEGVETQKQADYLRDCGIEFLQGYYYSKPLSIEQMLVYIEKWTK